MSLLYDNFFGPVTYPSFGFVPAFQPPVVDPFFWTPPPVALFDDFLASPAVRPRRHRRRRGILNPIVMTYNASETVTTDDNDAVVEQSTSDTDALSSTSASPTPSTPEPEPAEAYEEKNAEHVDLTNIDTEKSSTPAPGEAPKDGKENSQSAPDTTSPSNVVASPSTSRSLLDRHRAVKFSSNDKSLIIKGDFTGIPKEGITLEYNQGFLTLKATNKVEKRNKKGQVISTTTETFSRSFNIGRDVNPATIHASYNNGNFQVIIPKPHRAVPAVQRINIH